MMKKLFPFVVAFFMILTTSAQDNAGMKKHFLKVYSQALNYNDAATAINALQNYIAIDSGIAYKDTLSILYFTTKSYYSALILSEEVYKAMPKNVDAMARAAECYDELGDPKTAVGLFEQVVKANPNPYHFYKLAVSQYQIKRTAEAEASARMVLADTSAKRIGVPFTSMDGSQQAVPVNAAAANLIGVLRMDVKNYADAKKYFQDALTMYPQFSGAKGNLDVCDKNLKGAKVTTKPPVNKPKS
jgi:tetratricopeptide (TPR) repeat protein